MYSSLLGHLRNGNKQQRSPSQAEEAGDAWLLAKVERHIPNDQKMLISAAGKVFAHSYVRIQQPYDLLIILTSTLLSLFSGSVMTRSPN